MTITEIKAASSTNIQTGETWLKVSCNGVKSTGETDDELFDKLIQKADEYQAKWQAKRLAGQPLLPVIKEDSNAIKKFEQQLSLVKNRLREIPFKEDAQEFINGMPDFKEHYEVKIILSQKPNKK